MITNADITLYNKYYDRTLGHDAYLRSYIFNVNWQGARAVTVNDKGLITADFTEVFIYPPTWGDKNYMKPKEWAKSEEKELFFTLNAGDIIVKGIIDYAIAAASTKELINSFDDVLTIVSVVDLSETSLPHWEIGAK
jgi:hypothetical protein